MNVGLGLWVLQDISHRDVVTQVNELHLVVGSSRVSMATHTHKMMLSETLSQRTNIPFIETVQKCLIPGQGIVTFLM